MKHTALYLRVSTEAQADEGYSLAAQAEKLEAYCRMKGIHPLPSVCGRRFFRLKPDTAGRYRVGGRKSAPARSSASSSTSLTA